MQYDTLSHHGIKGQKWGIRRFQNKDGTLTAKGKSRYSSKESINKNNKLEDMSDEELGRRLKRLRMEDEYNRLSSKSINRGQKAVKKAIAALSTAAAVSSSIVTISKNASKIGKSAEKIEKNIVKGEKAAKKIMATLMVSSEIQKNTKRI